MNVSIEQELLGFVQSQSVTATTINCQTDLIEQEVLDSLLLMELVLFVEQSWGVRLMGSDFAPSHFRTVKQLTELVEDRRLQQSA